MSSSNALIETVDLKKHYQGKRSLGKKPDIVKALDGVSLSLSPGETLGVVGESGCGKSTLGRSILRLIQATDGDVLYRGESLMSLSASAMREMRKKLQIVYQDPYASLNPRMTVREIVQAPLDAFKLGTQTQRRERVAKILERVSMGPQMMERFPHEFSGGQRQRIVIARALVLEPEFVVCDEPVSALDVSVRSQVLNLMRDLQKEMDLTYLFISHDLSVVRHISDRVAVMYLGHVVEVSEKKELFVNPCHPYTKALMSAIPVPDVDFKRNRIVLEGDIPTPINPPSGCPFHTRCPNAMPQCAEIYPEMKQVNQDHKVACHLYDKK